MRKVITILLSAFILSGCGVNSVSSKDTVVFRIKDKNVTEGDVYNLMKQNSANEVISGAMKGICESEIGRPEEIDAFIKETITNYHISHEEEFKEKLEEEGLTEEEYSNTVLVPVRQKELLRDKYIEEHVKDLSEKYSARLVTILNYSSKEAAQKVLDSGEFPEADPVLITSDSLQVSEEVLKEILKAEKGTWSTAFNEESKEYFVFRVEEDDAEAFKEEFIDYVKANGDVSGEMGKYYLEKHHFKVFDEVVKGTVEGALNQ